MKDRGSTERSPRRRKSSGIALSRDAASGEARTRAIMEAIDDAAAVMDDRSVLDANENFARLFGYSRGEVLGLPPGALFGEAPTDPAQPVLARRKDGSTVSVRLRTRSVKGGEAGTRVVVARAIGGESVAEQQILALNAQLAEKVRDFETLIEVTPVGIAVAEDPECRMIRLNPAFAAMLGCSPAVNGSKTGPLADVLPFEIWKNGRVVEGRDLPMQEAAREGRVILDYEEDIVRSDGQVLHGLVQAAPLYGADGGIRGSIGVLLDITERKRAEEALASRERELRALFEYAGDGHSQADAKTGRYLRVNRKFCEMTGYSESELLEMTFYDLTHPEDRALNQGWINRAVSGQIEGYQLEKRYVRKDGTIIWVHVSVGFIRDASGESLQTVASVRDISVRKRVEEALQRTNEQLQQFAYAASHDLNEPLRNIVAFTQLIQKRSGETIDPESKEMLGIIIDSGQRMQALIDDLLSYTRAVAADSPQAVAEMTDCARVIQDVIEALDTQLLDAGADVIVERLPSVRARRSHLVQIFQNLISNAIKYRHRERRLRIEIGAAVGRGEVTFRVEDNGIGVAEPWREQIFGVFHRLHGREIPGTGIGLAICRRIVTHYGGRTWMEPAAGGGSRFCFSIPGSVAARAEGQGIAAASFDGDSESMLR